MGSRGLDLPGVAVVVNFDVPGDSKAYLHRAGRAARFAPGLSAPPPGTVITLVASESDEVALAGITQALGVEARRRGLSPLSRYTRVFRSQRAGGVARRSLCLRSGFYAGTLQISAGVLKKGKLSSADSDLADEADGLSPAAEAGGGTHDGRTTAGGATAPGPGHDGAAGSGGEADEDGGEPVEQKRPKKGARRKRGGASAKGGVAAQQHAAAGLSEAFVASGGAT